MSESESPVDSRFRIPRGSSDEEIDSDMASVGSSEQPERTHDAGHPSSALLSDTPGLRNAISTATGALRRGLPASKRREPVENTLADVSDSDGDPDDDALASVTLAATGRRAMDNAVLREVAPAGPEPSYPVINPDVSGAGDQAEMMTRLLNTLSSSGKDASSSPAVPALASLKKKIARLSASGKKALPVPLSEPVAGRIERSVAYEKASEELTGKWAGVVQRNRRSKVLSFPMNGPGERIARSTGDVARTFKAANEYEREIDHLLREAGVVNDTQVLDGEERDVNDDLGVANISKEELVERRRELAKVRSLVFHYDQKMKRIKKIKSRKYRRLLKKEKEKLKEIGNVSDGLPEEAAIRAERRRAEERMTLRHKNTSKWVRRQLSRGETRRNPEARAAIEEQLQLHQELKQRQEEEIPDSDHESDSDDSVGEGTEQWDEELHGMKKQLEEDQQRKQNHKKGIMGLRFMQAAQERKRKEAIALLNEMGNEVSEDEDDDENEIARDMQPVGRQAFAGAQVKESEKSKKQPSATDVDANVLDDDDFVNGEEGDDAHALKERVINEYEESAKNGTAGISSGAAGKLSQTIMGASTVKSGFTTALGGRLKADSNKSWANNVSSGAEKVTGTEEDLTSRGVATESDGKKNAANQNPWLNTVSADVGNVTAFEGGEKPRSKLANDEDNDDKNNVSAVVTSRDGAQKSSKKRLRFNGNMQGVERSKENRDVLNDKPRNFADDGDRDGEGDLARMSFVAKAFSGIGGADEADFQTMKDTEISRSLPTAKDLGAEVLPGWGSWDGAGMKKKERAESAFARAARERLEAARKNAISKRKDRKLAHVILDEKRVKQAAELTLASVPFPFTSAKQWQRELDTPVCQELLSGNAFSAGVAPRVKKKAGVVIEPLRHGALTNPKKRRRIEERLKEEKEREKDSAERGTKRRKGKKGVIDLRRERAGKRSASRKALLS